MKQAEQWEVDYIFPAPELLSLTLQLRFHLPGVTSTVSSVNKLLLFTRVLKLASSALSPEMLSLKSSPLSSRRRRPPASASFGFFCASSVFSRYEPKNVAKVPQKAAEKKSLTEQRTDDGWTDYHFTLERE